MAKAWKKPTLNLGQFVHLVLQVENLTGYSVDQLLDMIFSGNFTGNVKQVILDTIKRIKDEPFEVGGNAILYAVGYKVAKRMLAPYASRVDLGIFYLKPI